ncbi:hypothetical protein [Streptomyces sp. NPDC096132]|uniref:hypothetical protein n=1 Tax=Streptomyces sp. NPDC096132 TaxID=3366075 RepID=UPI00381F828F
MDIAAAFAVLTLVLAAAVTVLVRRDRRRFPAGPDSARIEADATRGLREGRRKAHLSDRFAVGGVLGALRDRDDNSRY